MSERTPTNTRRLADIEKDIRVVLFFWVLASLLGAVALVVYCWCNERCLLGSMALWALAIATCGATIGFLFGIPKVLQNPPPATPSGSPGGAHAESEGDSAGRAANGGSYAQRVNTNLEEISDWLTKIIVGVGLVELKELSPFFNGVADRIHGPGGAAHHSVALALIIFYATSGFLFGYLLTRLYLQGALARADRHSSSVGEMLREADEIQSELHRAIPPPTGQPGTKPVDAELHRLAKEYLSVSIDDHRQRLAKKNELATAMYKHAVENGISREALSREMDEALILTLAMMVHAAPLADDAARLLRVAGQVSRLHVQYRLTLAFGELHRQGFLKPAERTQVTKILSMYLQRADASLRRAIEGTLALFDRSQGE